MTSHMSLIHAELVQYSYRSIPKEIPNQRKYGYRNSSKWDTEYLHYGNRMGPPNGIEYDHRAYQMVYQMGPRETVEITTNR